MRRDSLFGDRLISRLLSTVYPSTCPSCDNPSDAVRCAPICRNCWGAIKRYTGPSCRICFEPFVSEHSTICGECLGKPPPFSKALSFGLYSGVLLEAIHLLKFSGLRRLAGPLAKLLLELPIPDADGIMPVPVTPKTLRTRGFNQTLLLSVVLSKERNIPVFMDTLHKRRETPPQIGLGAKERAANLKGAFEARGRLDAKRLILLDDVMTTGATARECSKTLIKAGAEEVTVITLARAPLP